MQAGFQYVIRSNPNTQFIEALAAGGASTAIYNLRGPFIIHDAVFKGVSMIVTEVCAYEIDLWGTEVGQPATDPLLDRWLGAWGFSEASFQQIGGSGLYRANIYGIDIPYLDLDYVNNTAPVPTIHASLVNRSVSNTKDAGADGAMQVALYFEGVGKINL
jgi:hypothetical protein